MTAADAWPTDSTGDKTRWVCPGCEPDADPLREALSIHYCRRHEPSRAGPDDVRAIEAFGEELGPPSGSMEGGGDANREWCGVIHRDRPSP